MAAIEHIDALLQQIEAKNQDDAQEDNIASKVPSYSLNHTNCNVKMPAIGFGLYNVTELERVTLAALQANYSIFVVDYVLMHVRF